MSKKKTSSNYFWILFVLIVPFINWLILLLEDYSEEKIVKSTSIWGDVSEYDNVSGYIRILNTTTKYLVILLPVVVGIIWYVFIKKNKINNKKGLLIDFGWIIVNIVYLLFFGIVNIIPQNPNVFFNGFEYIIFPMLWTIVPLLVLIILKIIYFIYLKIKK